MIMKRSNWMCSSGRLATSARVVMPPLDSSSSFGRQGWTRAGSMRARTVAFCAIVAVWAPSCAHNRPGSAEVPRQHLLERQTGFVAALEAKDPDKTSAYFSHDATIQVADMPPVVGREAIRQFYSKVFAFLALSEPTVNVIRVAASGDMAYVTGGSTNTFRRGEDTVTYNGKYLLVWEKRGPEWTIAMYSLSSDGPTR